jgi:hypothetical protein
MAIKKIPLSRLQTELLETLNEVAMGQTVVVELPDQRLVSIQSLDSAGDDDLCDELIETNPDFQKLLAKSKAGSRKPFAPAE